MKLQLLAVPLLVALMLSPAIAAAATGTLTFTSPAAGSSLSGTASYTISGTITPTPTLPDNVNIQVTNPSSQLVDVQTVAVTSSGTFSYPTNAGGSSAWTSGTYTILATDSNGATNTETFTYKASQQLTGGSQPLIVNARSASLVYAGQTVEIFAAAYWTTNETAANTVTWTASVWGPTGSPAGISWTTSSPATGAELWTGTLPNTAADGVYAADISVTDGSYTAWTLTSFQVNSRVANSSGLSAISSALTSLTATVGTISTAVSGISTTVGSISSTLGTVSSNVASIQSAVGTIGTNVQSLGTAVGTISSTLSTLSSSVSSISTGITTLTNDVTTMQTTVTSLQGLSQDMTNLQSSVSSLSSSVSNAQTYILVVAALAVITLVLELAILIRKMS